MFAKPLMFLSSYAPLFAILAIRVESTPVRLTCVALAVAGIAALIAILTFNRRTAPAQSTLTTVRNAGSEAASYLAGYLLPFLVVAQPTALDLIAYGLFLAVVGLVTIRTGVIQVNPLLFVFGFSIFQVQDSTGASFYLVSRGRLEPKMVVTTTSLNDDVRVGHVVSK